MGEEETRKKTQGTMRGRGNDGRGCEGEEKGWPPPPPSTCRARPRATCQHDRTEHTCMENHVVEKNEGKTCTKRTTRPRGGPKKKEKKKKRKKRTRMHHVDLDRLRSTGCVNPMHLRVATRAWKRTRRKTRNLRVGS